MNTLIFAGKNPSDTISFATSFADVLVSPDAINTCSVTISVYSGTDLTPANVLSGTPSITGGNTVNYTLTGGIAGVIYIVLVSAVTLASLTYTKAGYLAVVGTNPY